MITSIKGRSPFYPGHPVPVELFVGRVEQLNRIMNRGVGQVTEGKPIAIYIQGEYGIGKSSIAKYVQRAALDRGLHSIYAILSGDEINDVISAIMEGSILSGVYEPRKWEKISNWLAKYVDKLEFSGITINLKNLKKDVPNFASPASMLRYLTETWNFLKDADVKGIFLVIDEINGIASNPKFAYFIKSLVDSNAMSREPLPLLLMLCGVEERRREMIRNHQSVERIFDVIEIEPMSKQEMEQFFTKAFDSVNIRVDAKAMSFLTYYSAGFPKIMHLIGDAAYWLDQDGIVDENDARTAILTAAEDVGKKYVDQQVYKALRSRDYHSILRKIVKDNSMSFIKRNIAKGLTEGEKKKLNNFLQRMKKLKVLQAGDVPGEYVFTSRMVRLYIFLESIRKRKD